MMLLFRIGNSFQNERTSSWNGRQALQSTKQLRKADQGKSFQLVIDYFVVIYMSNDISMLTLLFLPFHRAPMVTGWTENTKKVLPHTKRADNGEFSA